MKKLIFALALLVMGGASISTASAASISPAATTISDVAQSDGALQLTGGYYGRRHYYYGGYPYRYYDGFCYDYPYHWRCKRYYYRNYYGYGGYRYRHHRHHRHHDRY